MNLEFVIIGIDLNLTLNSREQQGEDGRSDPLEKYFTHVFEDLILMDVEPIKAV